MDTELLYNSIREYCADNGISISQLEKELHFGTGAIGKWKQSFPSIEKVIAVADYFGVSVDDLCCLKRKTDVSQFMESLIKKTSDGKVEWYPCAYHKFLDIKFSPVFRYEEADDVYEAVYGIGKLYLKHKEDDMHLYISLKDQIAIKQNENGDQIWSLWRVIKGIEQDRQREINEYKESFIVQ